MKSASYWAKRFELLEKSQNKSGKTYVSRISKEYDKAINQLEKDISSWYARFAKENEISYAEAKRLLNSRELKAFRMDVNEYIEKGRSLDPKFKKELEQASAKVHVSRLESLKLQVQYEAERVAGTFSGTFDEYAKNTYSTQYYRTAYEIQKGIGVGWDFMKLDNNTLEKVISKPWATDGKNFSARVWDNRSKLVRELHSNLTQGIIRGESPQKMINRLRDRMNVSRSSAGRLIMTETAFFSSAANRDVYKALEVEKYQILATLDSRTSETCRDMDGKVFNRGEYEVGVTAPPFHVYCRTTTVPYFEDNETTRAARNPEGKYYKVPSDMSYRDWEKTFVEGGSKEGLEPVTPEKALLPINEASNLFKNYGNEHYQAMHNALIENGDEDLIRVWAQNEAELMVGDIKKRSDGAYFNFRSGVHLNLEKDVKGSNWSKPYQTSFHELGHNLDYLLGGKSASRYYSTSYKDGLFANTIKEEIETRINELNKKLKSEFDKLTVAEQRSLLKDRGFEYWVSEYSLPKWKKAYAYKAFEKELYKIDPIKRSAISDIVEGVTKGKAQAGFGHGKSYWKSVNVELEAFAEFWESVVNPEQWETLREYLPKSTAIFKEMIKEAIK